MINAFINYLQPQRFLTTPSRKNVRRKKLTVEPGKSVTGINEDSENEAELDDPVSNDNSDDEPKEETEKEAEFFEQERGNCGNDW